MKLHKLFRILLLIALLAALFAGGAYLAFWNWPVHLFSIDPNEIYSVEFYRGGYRGNEYIVVRDPDVIHYLADHLSSLTFRRRVGFHSAPLVMGGEGLSLRTKQGNMISVYPSQLISKDRFLWEAYPPGINMDYINELMETAPGT